METPRDPQHPAPSSEDDELAEEVLPIPLSHLPAWWGPVATQTDREQLVAHELDLVEFALEHGHDENALIEFASANQPEHRYLVCRRLSATKWAAVYIAIDMLMERPIVLKISRRWSDAEARQVVKIRHPHVVTVHDVFVHEGYPTIVLEWCSQGSLFEYARYSDDWVSILARAIEGGRGLAYCHAQGVVHGDVKLGNFLITDELGKLADLGIARPPTLDGPCWGTPTYAPPERQQGMWSFAGDVYSFGRVLEDALLMLEVPESLGRLMNAAMRDDPEERPSLDSLLADLQAVLDEVDRTEWERERQELKAKLRTEQDSRRAELEQLRVEQDSRRDELEQARQQADRARAEVDVTRRKTLRRTRWVATTMAAMLTTLVILGVQVMRPQDPVDETIELAHDAVERGDGVAAVQYLELATRRGKADFDHAALLRVAEAAETLGHLLVASGDGNSAKDSWLVAAECFLEIHDQEGVRRTARLIAETPSP
ncbi:protein kinase domain-containing protein [Nannocystaceae bacterium ST9]